MAFATFTGILVALGVFIVGPRPEFRPPQRSAVEAHVPSNPAELDAWLADDEADEPALIAGAEKSIAWAGTPGVRTPISLVYIHGFSASRKEISPVMELVAQDLGANLFFTRLAGHGTRPTTIGDATSEAWLEDALEALIIGQRIGERTVVVGRSTGATLTAWLMTLDEGPDAAVMLSPNFGPRASEAELVLLPWLTVIVPRVIPEHAWEPKNAYQANYWTTRYPTTAVVEMMELVRAARGLDYSRVTTPALAQYNVNDQVVDPRRLKRIVSLHRDLPWTVEGVETAPDIDSDVFTGNAVNPAMTLETRRRLVTFIRENVP